MVALALLIAESEPAQKDLMIRLVLNLLDEDARETARRYRVRRRGGRPRVARGRRLGGPGTAPEIAPGEAAAERDDYGEVVLERRLRAALARLNPALPAEALEDAFRKLTRPEGRR